MALRSLANEILVNRPEAGHKERSLASKQSAALNLKGRYMGTKRRLPAVKRAKVKRVRATEGIRPAIAAAG